MSKTTEASWETVMQAEDQRRASETGWGNDRLALRQPEAATALGMGVDSFVRHVAPEINMVRLGKLRLVPVTELDRWLGENSVRVRGDR